MINIVHLRLQRGGLTLMRFLPGRVRRQPIWHQVRVGG
jgi:hypothetical protein